jgi:cytochrome b
MVNCSAGAMVEGAGKWGKKSQRHRWRARSEAALLPIGGRRSKAVYRFRTGYLGKIVLHVIAIVLTELHEGGSIIAAMFTGTKLLSGPPEDR